MKLHLFFSHSLTQEQQQDAQQALQVTKEIPLPERLQKLWSNVPPELEDLNAYTTPFLQYIEQEIAPEDYVLVQGDFGMVNMIVGYCKLRNKGIPIYATTERKAVEVVLPDGTVEVKRTFKHKIFRQY
ncbi:CRISPR-associated protein Csx20 [Algivirga pacifica]|uniref:CRISPR-associated protein Csx20 n=1 Tax=Algivirga pacifica TaxID=1162670 RepID=A0ABP9D607_9BACT